MKKIISKKIILIGLLISTPLCISLASESLGSINGSNSLSNGIEVTLPCSPASVSNGSVNSNTCVITCNSNYTLSSNSCVANTTSNNNGGGGGGGGGGGTVTPTCSLSNLICTDGIYIKKSGVSCDGGQAGNSCTISSGSNLDTGGFNAPNIQGSPFSVELNDAYKYAFANRITTMNTIQKADMEGKLIRSHMAKMVSNYAIKVLGKTINTGLSCNFNDVDNETSEIKLYIKISCQLGLMGWNSDGTIQNENFNPKDEVTRAQFGTILSRAIYGTKYNGGTPYYLNHLNALKKNEIITNTNPELKELRGFVMLMMMRANK
ncbi:MAG: S-layer homology domain-containing protein [Candidatus Absconditabacterales bacterium]